MKTFAEWLKDLGFSLEAIDDQQKQKLEAKYNTEVEVFEAEEEKKNKAKAGKGGGKLKAEDDPNPDPEDPVATERARFVAERRRLSALGTVSQKYTGQLKAERILELEAKAAEELWDPDKLELALLREARPKASASHRGGGSDNAVTTVVLEASICMSLHMPDVEKQFKPEILEQAHRRRHIGLQETLMLAACSNGYNGSPGERVNTGNLRDVLAFAFPNPRDRQLQAGFSTVSLPGIFSNIANKELLLGYMEEDQTWREISTVKPVSNFQQVTSYRMLDDMEYEELPPDGQIAHGALGEESYTRQAKTYAKMFGLSRRDIINDNLGAFDDLRTRLGRGGAKKLNNVFWAKFVNNSAFFTTARGNYITGATSNLGIDGVGLEAGVLAYRKLRTPAEDGQKRLGSPTNGRPDKVLVPPELEFNASRLYQSTQVNTGGSSTASSVGNANIHAGKYRPVVCNWLSDSAFTGYSTTAWYLLGGMLVPMVVSFLNGQETPTVESTDADFDTLGIQFRGYHDFGADQAEYLGGVKSKGAA